jgi:hypothetical protein
VSRRGRLVMRTSMAVGRGFRVTEDERRTIRELRYADGLSVPVVVRITGRCYKTVRKYAPGSPGKVNNARLREAFLASGVQAVDVARQIGWWNFTEGYWKADGSRIKRTLGINPDISGQGKRSYRTLIDAETAALLAEAIPGIEPWEVA